MAKSAETCFFHCINTPRYCNGLLCHIIGTWRQLGSKAENGSQGEICHNARQSGGAEAPARGLDGVVVGLESGPEILVPSPKED